MYTFRSKLIHVTLDIPSKFIDFNSSKEYENYSEGFYHSTCLAVSILTATLQELIIRDKKSLEFKYIIVE